MNSLLVSNNVWNIAFYSNDKKIFNNFKILFQKFQIKTIDNKCDVDKIIVMNNSVGKYDIYVNDKIINKNCPKKEVLGLLIEEIFSQELLKNNEYIYLHGGAFSKNDSAIILLAPSNMGKTTLTLDFLKYGYSYYTDDIVFLNRSDLTITEFPKPLFLRKDTVHRPNCHITITNQEYIRDVYIPERIETKKLKVKIIFILNRNILFSKNGSAKKLDMIQAFNSILYNIYHVSTKEIMINSISNILKSIPIYELNYYSSFDAINIIEKVLNNYETNFK